jgi:Endonuclease NucS
MASWQDHFLEAFVAAAHATGDQHLATAAYHRRKKTVSVQHPQVRMVEFSLGPSRKMGSQAQVLLMECQPKRSTEIDSPSLARELTRAGFGGEVQVDHETVWLQKQWGHGLNAVLPVHDARRVRELTDWATRSMTLLFDHLERRQRIVVPVSGQGVSSRALNLRVTLEHYLEDLLVEQWDTLPWREELEYLDRQVDCDAIGTLDIFARDRSSGDYVVIELKRDQADDQVVGQVSRYMGWIKKKWADHQRVNVRGIIVAHEATDRLRSAVLAHPHISVFTYQFTVTLTPALLTVNEIKSTAQW